MGTSPSLPKPDVCKTEKFILSADYWTCLVADPDPCLYAVKIGNCKICSIASKSGTALKQKIEEKKIFVRYADTSLGSVPRVKIDALIESGRITAFMRSSGWVDITKDQIRSKVSHWQFKGLQRRTRFRADSGDSMLNSLPHFPRTADAPAPRPSRAQRGKDRKEK